MVLASDELSQLVEVTTVIISQVIMIAYPLNLGISKDLSAVGV